MIKKDISVSGDRKCPVLDRACRLCGVIGHIRVKCPRAGQRGGGGGSGSRGGKSSKGADDGRENTGSGQGDSRGRRGRGRGRWQETNLRVDGNYSQEPTRLRHSPEFAFPVEQLAGHEWKSSDLITLIVGGVAVSVSDVLIDSGATCNVMGNRPGRC